MKKIRIGIDIEMRWSITTNGAATSLAGRDLTLDLTDPYGRVKTLPFVAESNVAKFTFYGIDHKRLGRYTLTMWENKGKEGQNAVDKVDAFELVRTTAESGGRDDENIQSVISDLGTGNFQIGYDDTEIKKEIAEVRKLVEDTGLVGATAIGGGGAEEKEFV